MRWSILYDNFDVYSGDSIEWKDLPEIGVIRVSLIFPDGSKMQVSGWDYYVIEILGSGTGIRATYWKDLEQLDINKEPIMDPFAGQFGCREFWDDKTNTPIIYRPNEELPLFAPEVVKHGRWVPEDIAKEMRIL